MNNSQNVITSKISKRKSKLILRAHIIEKACILLKQLLVTRNIA